MLKFITLLSFLTIIHVNASDKMEEQGPKSITKERDGTVMLFNESETSLCPTVVNFGDFLGKDPHALEEEYQRFCKLKKFREAAVYLIGAAMCGLSEEMDYLLKIDAQALRYIQNKDSVKIEEVITRIAAILERQSKYMF